MFRRKSICDGHDAFHLFDRGAVSSKRTDRQTGWRAGRQADRQTDRKTDRQTDRQTDIIE